MKQLIFMLLMTGFGTLGVVAISPFCGVWVYYLYAVLRPQFMWEWSLPRGISWSFYVGCAAIAGAVLVLMGGIAADRRDPARIRHVHGFTSRHKVFFCFAVWIIITGLTARVFEVTLPILEEYIKIFVMYFVSAFLIRSVMHVWALFLMVALTLGYISYEVNFLYLAHGFLGIYHEGYAGLDNNGAGVMLAMGVPICWFCFEGTRQWWRYLYLPIIPIIVHAVLMTYSRGAMLSLIVMLPVMLVRSKYKIQLTLVLVLFAVVLVPAMAGAEIRARFFTISEHEIDESAKSRRMSWNAGFRIANDYPIFGVGVRNSDLLSHAYGADMEGRAIHCQYLQLAADNGWVGLGLYLLVLITSWLATRRVRLLAKARPDDQEARLARSIACGLECAMVLLCFGAIFLSMEVFELPFLLLMMCAQLELVSGAREPHMYYPEEEETEEEESPELAGVGPGAGGHHPSSRQTW